MKTIKFLLLGLFIVGHLSCSKDDDKKPADLVGTWMLTEGIVEPSSMVVELAGMQIPVEISGSFVGIDDQNRINFNEDKTFTSVTGEIVVELELTVMGVPQTERFEADDIFGAGTWERTGNELKIHNDNNTTIVYRIESINETHLELSSNIRDMMVDNGSNPILEDMDVIVRMKLQRI